jgi:predicted DNA-binding transcriptional regulator YafY
MSASDDVINRCLALIPLIREHQGMTLDELSQLARLPKEQIAEELGQVMLMCGVPPYFPHDFITFSLDGERVEIRFADHFRRPVSLNPLEALALKVACESLVPPGKPASRAVATLLRKVEGAMSAEQRRQFRNLARRITVQETDALPGGITGRVALAVAERRAITLDYLAAGRRTSREREVEPYGLLCRDGHWYLVALDLSRSTIVPFRLDRVRELHVLERRFEIAGDFRLDDYARAPLFEEGEERTRARVRIRGPSARWMRETAAPGCLEDLSDDVVLWRPAVGSEEGLARFLLSFGSDAEVLEPLGLRERVVSGLKQVLAAHS